MRRRGPMLPVAAGAGAALLWAAGAWAGQHPVRAAPLPPASGAARDGISGGSVARAGAHGIVGGPAARKPSSIGAVTLKLRH